MAKREIRTGIGTYLRQDGIWHFGSLGEEVDVNDADIERFDRLNGVQPDVVLIHEEQAEPESEEQKASDRGRRRSTNK